MQNSNAQCHSVSSLDSVPHCWRVSCIGSEVVAPSYFTAPKLSPVCPSGGDQHYKAGGPLSMYQCQYAWVRESTAAIVMVRPYVLLQCLRAGPSCSQRLLPPSSCCLSPPPAVPQEISRANPPSLLFARMRLLCQPLLLVRIDFVIAIKDETFI